MLRVSWYELVKLKYKYENILVGKMQIGENVDKIQEHKFVVGRMLGEGWFEKIKYWEYLDMSWLSLDRKQYFNVFVGQM